jgi:acetyltransferase-like isoleucine patch superfamily enzyme
MGNLIVGKRTYGNNNIVRKGTHNSIIVGSYCSIAENCVCDGGWGHNTKFITTYPFNEMFDQCSHLTGHPVCRGDIVIGNDVWIGNDCIIMSGVTIGDGAVIGARSIVTKDVEPYAIYAGCPAKHIRKRFTDKQINNLLKIKWWDWDDTEIIDNADLLMSENIDQFINKNIGKLHENN